MFSAFVFKCESVLCKEFMSLEIEIIAGSIGESDCCWLLLFVGAELAELFNGGKSAELIAEDLVG